MLKTFSIGGVHPHENKLSAHQPIITAEVPAKAVILLGQHIGAPAKPVVAKGDVVKVGTRIAEPAGFVSAAIHSSVSGKVAKIDTIVDASGYAKPAIFIDVEGDQWEETIDRSKTLVKECDLSAEEIVKKIADAGIVFRGPSAGPPAARAPGGHHRACGGVRGILLPTLRQAIPPAYGCGTGLPPELLLARQCKGTQEHHRAGGHPERPLARTGVTQPISRIRIGGGGLHHPGFSHDPGT